MTLRTLATAAASAALLHAAPAPAQEAADTFACDPLRDAIAEERLPVRWIPARGVLAELVEADDPAVCKAALDVVSPSGISELGPWDGACREALQAADDMAADDPEAAALALGRVAVAAGSGGDCAAALEG